MTPPPPEQEDKGGSKKQKKQAAPDVSKRAQKVQMFVFQQLIVHLEKGEADKEG